jgi:hypothetical protein
MSPRCAGSSAALVIPPAARLLRGRPDGVRAGPAAAPHGSQSKYLLGHGRAWRGGVSAWTHAHERWLLGQQFDEPALAATCSHYRAVLQSRDAQLDAIEADLAGWYDRPPFAEQVARLSAYRGITRLGALTLAAEVGDWRRFPRASAFMGSVGWSPAGTAAGARPEPAALPVGPALLPVAELSTADTSYAGSRLSALRPRRPVDPPGPQPGPCRAGSPARGPMGCPGGAG